jgi:hypothetical protein
MRHCHHSSTAVIALAMLALLTTVGGASADGEVRLIHIRPPDSSPTTRTYFVGASATSGDAVTLRDDLLDAGARNVNLFLPDKVIVCDMSASASARVAIPSGFSVRTAADVRSMRVTAETDAWGWIVQAYDLSDRTRTGAASTAPAMPETGDAFHDVVLTIPPERIREIDRDLARTRVLDGTSATTASRSATQNSEFLGGSILANFIFPESTGGAETKTDSWTDNELRDAKIGAANAYLSWQGLFTPMDISTTFNMLERVSTVYEPIKHNMTNDVDWIVDAMRSLGWGLHSSKADEVVHEFNEAMRGIYHTQWVVSCFIADSRSVPNHRFGYGTANYTAYAFLGGPYMVEPFPAGTDPNGIGEILVFSKIVNHECGHNFYTLDEYPGAPGGCGDASGYLNYSNGNISMVDPGGNETRCQELERCIMHLATREGTDRPWCHFSLGHLGVIDSDGKNGPDIFGAPPAIVFEPEGPETVSTNQVVLRFKAISQAVPNRNPREDPDHRLSYAVPINRVTLSLGGAVVTIPPLDGHFDETTEEFEIPVSLAQAGPSGLIISASNGFVSSTATKKIYFTGVNYTRVGATVHPAKIDVTWETAGDVFQSKFDVFKLRPGESAPGEMIAHDVAALGPGAGGFVSYQYTDTDVEPGVDYRYYVDGVFSLPCDSVVCVYHAPSQIIGQTAMLPVSPTDFVSSISPNPSNGNITVSIQVPRTYGGPPLTPQRLPTDVDVTIYDVLGRRIRTLKSVGELSDVVTLRWDGYGENSVRAPAGVYFLRVKAGEGETVRKIVLLR